MEQNRQKPFEGIYTKPVDNPLAVDVRRLQYMQLDDILHSVPEYREQFYIDPYFHKSMEQLQADCSPETIVSVVSFLCKTIADQQKMNKELNDHMTRRVMI